MIRAALLALAALLTPASALEVTQITTPAGQPVWLVEEPGIPFTALELWFKGGTSLDAPGKRGAVSLMTGLLEEGAAGRDAVAFSEAKEELAARFRFNASGDALTVSARFLTENRAEAVALLRDALTEPRFDAQAIERVRGQMLSIIEQNAKDPGQLSSDAFFAEAFGPDPYGSPDTGTAESVAALSRDDLLAAKAATMARDRVIVSAVGDITAEELGPLVDGLLAGLPAAGAPLPARITPALTSGQTVIDFPSPQTQITFGQAALRRDDPDFFAAVVMEHILGGGGFSSRLMDEVREKRGLTYGIGTSLVNLSRADLLMGGFASSNDKVAEALEVTRAEWARLAEGGVTEKELADAKTYLTGSYPLRFDGNGTIASILAGMQLAELPATYITERNAKVEAVTAEDVARVAKRLLGPGGLRFVLVGQPKL